MKLRMLTGVASAAALVVALTGCEAGPASGSGADIVDDDTSDLADEEEVEEASEAEDEPEPDEAAQEEEEPAVEEEDDEDAGEEAELGTRDNPLELGTRIAMGDWTLAVTDVTLDATDAVMAENEFNDPPADGRQFVMFHVEAIYEGEDSGTAWLDFSWGIVGSQGNTFATGMDDYCGVIPEPLDDTGETFPGGSVDGNVCISVPSDQVDGATIRIEDTFSFEDTRAFYAVD